MAAYSYSKAYRVSKSVTGIIENYSGYSEGPGLYRPDDIRGRAVRAAEIPDRFLCRL